ncbi:secreted protein [Candidatus Thiomargarita nelsonii]|uniref:Secreted protein n=1 Tax=Candidatus Thiomargarita nelsonii TaxID=1003181 RepID=A0A176S6B0_9GAMM|nr:secreted protein [Candidatus Thiomargarita nelsonii]
MTKRLKLKTALLLAAAVNVSYASESCFPPKKGQTPLDVLECLQKGLDTLTAKTEKQQKRIVELEKENEALRQKTDAISVLNNAENRIRFGSLDLVGDKPHANHGIGPALSFHSQFPDSKDNRHLYFHLGDTWNNQGVSKNDFVIHSWNHAYKNHVKHMVLRANGNVGIGTTPTEKLQVAGNVKATAFKTGDIFFEKDGETLWQMFEDENGLYLKQIKTGKTFRLMLEEIQ